MKEVSKITTSILIPAHNEAAVIGRTLAHLGRGLCRDTVEVIVIPNGCRDRTADAARDAMPEAIVLETQVPGKAKAMRLGLARARGAAIVFLDADLDVDAAAIGRLVAPLLRGEALASHGGMDVDLAGCSAAVRGFYAIWQRGPYLRGGKFGGLFAVSRAGLDRITPLPDVTADDEYVSRAFRPSEKAYVRDVRFVARAPRTLAALFAVRKRVRRGTRELGRMGHGASGGGGRGQLVGALARPMLWAPLLVFLSLTVSVRVALMFEATGGAPKWERDDSSRVPVARRGDL
jgi:glycosyltransferase involved in cell wall biosynthesis